MKPRLARMSARSPPAPSRRAKGLPRREIDQHDDIIGGEKRARGRDEPEDFDERRSRKDHRELVRQPEPVVVNAAHEERRIAVPVMPFEGGEKAPRGEPDRVPEKRGDHGEPEKRIDEGRSHVAPNHGSAPERKAGKKPGRRGVAGAYLALEEPAGHGEGEDARVDHPGHVGSLQGVRGAEEGDDQDCERQDGLIPRPEKGGAKKEGDERASHGHASPSAGDAGGPSAPRSSSLSP